MVEERTVKYAIGAITVLWQPDRCMHTAIGIEGLGQVFVMRKKSGSR